MYDSDSDSDDSVVGTNHDNDGFCNCPRCIRYFGYTRYTKPYYRYDSSDDMSSSELDMYLLPGWLMPHEDDSQTEDPDEELAYQDGDTRGDKKGKAKNRKKTWHSKGANPGVHRLRSLKLIKNQYRRWRRQTVKNAIEEEIFCRKITRHEPINPRIYRR